MMKSCFRSCEMLPAQEASEVLILNKSKHSEAICEHLSLCLWVPYLNQAQNGQVRNKIQLNSSRSTEKGFQLKRNGWASSHTNHLSGTSGQNLPEHRQKGWGSLTLSLPSSSLSQKPKMAFPVLDTNYWFKKCCTLCHRLKKTPYCPGKYFPGVDFPPLSTSTQEVPAVSASPSKAGSANFQLRSELRFVPFAEEFGHVLDFLDAGNAKSFLWRLFLDVIACYNVWAQRGVQSSP